MRRQFDYINKGQWGREWDELHPAQQELVPRDLFIQCAPAGLEVQVTDVLETYEEDVVIDGTDQSVRATALTVEFKSGQDPLANSDIDTFHEVVVAGEWRWIMADVEGYRRGQCP